MFKNAGLIGLGLMGGSLARAMKTNAVAKTITGYTKSLDSSNMALQLGIIDNIAQCEADIAQQCDVIIICTPLSTYEEIFKNMAPVLRGKNTIITDVGSLKSSVINAARKFLPEDNMKRFIPAHPIAGTEKTGVMAGFDTLFAGKKTILTKLPENSEDAVNIVSKLWLECGSNVQVMDAKLHDAIYAEVSHLPQFVAYCYAALLFENKNLLGDIFDLKQNKSFQKFTRICASDPVIWFDIFTMNQQNLAIALEKFICEIKTTDKKSAQITKETLTKKLPVLIANSLINSTSSAQYAGSGFKDFTSAHDWENIEDGCADILIEILLAKTNELMELLSKNNYDNSINFMQKAADYALFLRADSSRV